MEHEGSEVVKKCVGLAVSLHRALLPFIHKHFHFTVYVAGILSVLESLSLARQQHKTT